MNLKSLFVLGMLCLILSCSEAEKVLVIEPEILGKWSCKEYTQYSCQNGENGTFACESTFEFNEDGTWQQIIYPDRRIDGTYSFSNGILKRILNSVDGNGKEVKTSYGKESITFTSNELTFHNPSECVDEVVYEKVEEDIIK